MKRYFVFAYYYYYPNGGMNDCKGSYKTLEEAMRHVLYTDPWTTDYDCAFIYDMLEMRQIRTLPTENKLEDNA